jgi:hypothetical protein
MMKLKFLVFLFANFEKEDAKNVPRYCSQCHFSGHFNSIVLLHSLFVYTEHRIVTRRLKVGIVHC